MIVWENDIPQIKLLSKCVNTLRLYHGPVDGMRSGLSLFIIGSLPEDDIEGLTRFSFEPNARSGSRIAFSIAANASILQVPSYRVSAAALHESPDFYETFVFALIRSWGLQDMMSKKSNNFAIRCATQEGL